MNGAPDGKLVWHSHQPRCAFCHRYAAAGFRADDQGRADHRQEGRQRRRGHAPAASAPHRKAAGGRQRLSLHRVDHGQGHRKGAPAPARIEGRAGPAAGRCRDDGGRCRFRAQRAADRCWLRHGRGRYRAWSLRAGSGNGEPYQARLELRPGACRQCRDRRRRTRR